ncbi:hypothetical protein [Haliscomenobacter hydrossis]|uniref:Auto-transporter adhesin head GIN domain-containing protein n=1 Tax=Haliscomenobacter hydrossis (strain ATCC 27775 / DSM 1100 / LMG 10767 / O) TaxID=760192 RepID=F4KWE0_HALH1|nr:hypothetical protein [Haliscomenobacter hydrossis]AEE50290.1 hypothetical protein Halhy_2416 [Haliscomenobacter hydrossis DSM 1100]
MRNSFKTLIPKLSIVLLLLSGTFSFVHAQGVDTAQASILLKGDLQNLLVNKLSGKLGSITVSDKFTLTNASLQIASRRITAKIGTVDQITIKITEAGKTHLISVLQGADGKLSELRSGQLVAISGSNPLTCITQLFGSASSCGTCKTKIVNCITQNSGFLARARSIARSFDGSCISCGISLITVYNCLKGN